MLDGPESFSCTSVKVRKSMFFASSHLFPHLFVGSFAGKGVQTRGQTDSQAARARHGHEPGGRAPPAGHRIAGRRPDQWPGPGRTQGQHTHAHVRPFPVRRPARLLSGPGLRSRPACHEVRV